MVANTTSSWYSSTGQFDGDLLIDEVDEGFSKDEDISLGESLGILKSWLFLQVLLSCDYSVILHAATNLILKLIFLRRMMTTIMINIKMFPPADKANQMVNTLLVF